jgi:hypothetical protein
MPNKLALFRGFSTFACKSCGNRSEKRGNYTPDGGKGETRGGNEPFGMLRKFSHATAQRRNEEGFLSSRGAVAALREYAFTAQGGRACRFRVRD